MSFMVDVTRILSWKDAKRIVPELRSRFRVWNPDTGRFVAWTPPEVRVWIASPIGIDVSVSYIPVLRFTPSLSRVERVLKAVTATGKFPSEESVLVKRADSLSLIGGKGLVDMGPALRAAWGEDVYAVYGAYGFSEETLRPLIAERVGGDEAVFFVRDEERYVAWLRALCVTRMHAESVWILARHRACAHQFVLSSDGGGSPIGRCAACGVPSRSPWVRRCEDGAHETFEIVYYQSFHVCKNCGTEFDAPQTRS